MITVTVYHAGEWVAEAECEEDALALCIRTLWDESRSFLQGAKTHAVVSRGDEIVYLFERP